MTGYIQGASPGYIRSYFSRHATLVPAGARRPSGRCVPNPANAPPPTLTGPSHATNLLRDIA